MQKPDFSKAFKIFLSYSSCLTSSLALLSCYSSLTSNRDSRTPNQNENELTDKKNTNTSNRFKNNVILSEIKYLTLGDSISAGFNWDYSFDFRGNINKNLKIKGLSYAAFFADFIQKIKPNAIKSFDNLALSWTTIKDWLYLLDSENEKFQNFDKIRLNFNYELDKLTKSPYGKQIRDVFGNFSAKNYPKLKEKIKNANLLTVSLGANDLMESIDFKTIAKPNQKIATKAEAAAEFVAKINLAIVKLEKNLNIFIEKIRKINPNLEIVLVGYNILFSSSMKFFDKLLTNELGLPNNYTIIALKQLNEAVKKVAQKQGINFVDLYNERSWLDKANKFAKNEFDIHPSTKGYKKMAQDLLFKLALEQGPNFKTDYFEKLDWNQEYFEKDSNCYKRILNLGPNSEIFKTLSIDNSVNKFITNKSEIEEISSAEIEKVKNSQLAILSRIWYEVSFGTFIDGFLRSNTQISEKLREMLINFWQQNAKNNPSFSKLLHQFLQSDFWLEIIGRFQNYINDVIINQNLEKATISGLTSFLFTDFSEKKLISVFKDAVNSDFASQNINKIKELIFICVFGQSAIQELLINSIIGISAEYKSDLQVIFSFESTRNLFTKIINDFVLESAKYENVNNFLDILKIFLDKPKNYENIVKFSRNFISESLKHRKTVNFLVQIINSNFNLNLSEDDKNALISLLLSVSDTIIRTKTWEKLNNEGAKSFLNIVKNTDFRHTSKKISTILGSQVQGTYALFFKNTTNLINLLHELLSFDLSNYQIEVLKRLLTKLYPLISKFKLSYFISTDSPNYNNFSVFFNSVKGFLIENSFQIFNKIISEAINDFVVNKLLYQKIGNLNRFGFEFLRNNLEKFEENIFDFLAKCVNNIDFFTNLSDLINKSLQSEGLSQKSVLTFSKIIKTIFDDFGEKYKNKQLNKNEQDENLIFILVKEAIKSFKNFTNDNFNKYNELKVNLEKAEDEKNNSKINFYKTKIDELENNLSIINFSNFFLKNLIETDIKYKILKNIAKINLKNKIGSQDLILFFKDLFSKSFLHKQIVSNLENNRIFGKEGVKNSLLELLVNFFNSNQVEKLLEKFVDYFFESKKFEKTTDFTGFVTNFIKEHAELIEKIFGLFLGDTATWNSLSNFLMSIFQASKINLSEKATTTILTLVRNIFTKWKNSTLNFENNQKTESPLVIQALIKIIFDSFSHKHTLTKSIFESIIDSLSVDISNNYYKKNENSWSTSDQISQNEIANLFAEIAQTEAISEKIKSNLINIHLEYREKIQQIFDAFLKSNALVELFDGYFKIIAKAEINEPLNNFSLVKSLFENQYFTKIIGKFIIKLENNVNLKQNFTLLLSKIFNVNFEENEFEPLFKLIKYIIQDNINNYYSNEEDPKNFLYKKLTNNSNLSSENTSQNNENLGTENSENTIKYGIYFKKNALLTKLVSLISKLANTNLSTANINFILENEIGNEEFIIEFLKQIGRVFDKTTKTDQEKIWEILVKIFKSNFLMKGIEFFKFSNFNKYRLFEKLSIQKKEQINSALKSAMENFLPNPVNKLLIFRIFNFINQNPDKFKEIRKFSGLLTEFLKDNQTSSNMQENQKLTEKIDNSAFLKSYLWYLINFLVKNEEFSQLIVSQILEYLHLDIKDEKNSYLKTKGISNPEEIIKNFLSHFINLGFENKIIENILDQIINSVKSAHLEAKSNFFDNILTNLKLSEVLNLDLLVNLEEKITDEKTLNNKLPQLEPKIDEHNLIINLPQNQQIPIDSFVDFLDLIFLASPKWNKEKQAEVSPLLKELNNITYTGISFADLLKSNQKDLKLEAISRLFSKIYSENITKENYKNSARGRNLYRFLLMLLFYAYESRIKNSPLRASAFYGSILSSSTASEMILNSLKNAGKNEKNSQKYSEFIDFLKGNPIKVKGWWINTWYTAKDVRLDDMLTLIYYNNEDNRFKNETGQEKLKDQILEQIRQGHFPDNFENPKIIFK
ncbi:SGNH/GDSL hydrolase family protein [Mycoplasma hyopneumoniae]|uniref:SGNH/GDSL hydrolase family protein n=1 Tax=Mesomycoplasma hyopneumoniae TaxID=2099 RepID=UPI00136B549E|nr:SGNH/GDSL hydrolase family protein [Mesomycoplasma hyopneumoniae]MXR10615.1 SGNH/GDSL hydrolase family protein [Mesomycoplasma hyopneumoniae]MXR63872.1 SGNH/GDSL hydrolase family protein [Mesomycoplasma hyopneumoniae]